jgi:hypothetical protein
MLPHVGLTKAYLKLAVIQGDLIVTKFPKSNADSRRAAKNAAAYTAYQFLCSQYPNVDLNFRASNGPVKMTERLEVFNAYVRDRFCDSV